MFIVFSVLMKGTTNSGQQPQGHSLQHQQSCSIPPPSIPNFTVPPPSMVAPYQHPPNLPQLASQGTPSQDVIMKLLQVQQQQQQKRQHHLLQQVRQLCSSLPLSLLRYCKHHLHYDIFCNNLPKAIVFCDEKTGILPLLQNG